MKRDTRADKQPDRKRKKNDKQNAQFDGDLSKLTTSSKAKPLKDVQQNNSQPARHLILCNADCERWRCKTTRKHRQSPRHRVVRKIGLSSETPRNGLYAGAVCRVVDLASLGQAQEVLSGATGEKTAAISPSLPLSTLRPFPRLSTVQSAPRSVINICRPCTRR